MVVYIIAGVVLLACLSGLADAGPIFKGIVGIAVLVVTVFLGLIGGGMLIIPIVFLGGVIGLMLLLPLPLPLRGIAAIVGALVLMEWLANATNGR